MEQLKEWDDEMIWAEVKDFMSLVSSAQHALLLAEPSGCSDEGPVSQFWVFFSSWTSYHHSLQTTGRGWRRRRDEKAKTTANIRPTPMKRGIDMLFALDDVTTGCDDRRAMIAKRTASAVQWHRSVPTIPVTPSQPFSWACRRPFFLLFSRVVFLEIWVFIYRSNKIVWTLTYHQTKTLWQQEFLALKWVSYLWATHGGGEITRIYAFLRIWASDMNEARVLLPHHDSEVGYFKKEIIEWMTLWHWHWYHLQLMPLTISSPLTFPKRPFLLHGKEITLCRRRRRRLALVV